MTRNGNGIYISTDFDTNINTAVDVEAQMTSVVFINRIYVVCQFNFLLLYFVQ